MSRKMPEQKPGKSEQVVRTPRAFTAAVELTFGALSCDLAACADNVVHLSGLEHLETTYGDWFGPDNIDPSRRDSLTAEWPGEGQAWLNPPFGMIGKFAKKCARECAGGSKDMHILMLVPASVGANWYRDHVQPFADVYSVGRMKFVGHEDVYPKDLILAHYWKPGGYKFRHWKWQ